MQRRTFDLAQAMRDASNWLFVPAADGSRRIWRAALVAAWLALVLVMITRHVFFRDEVRALSIALEGDGLPGMLAALHGEGHPAVWYLLLRAAHTVVASPLVLPAVSLLVALFAAGLLAVRSPFGWIVVAAILLGRIGAYEYVVMARNYGISMLAMFLFAALYTRYRDRTLWLGCVLLVLANCNAHSVIIAGALAVFWLLDLLYDGARPWDARLRNFAANAVILAVGVVLCAITILPTFNDAAQSAVEPGGLAIRLVKSLLLPATQFMHLAGSDVVSPVLDRLPILDKPFLVAMSVVVIGSTFGLRHRPAALYASLVALLGMTVFFAAIYPGNYRHQALWLVLLITLYWIAGPAPADKQKTGAWVQPAGSLLFAVLLLVQVAASYPRVARALAPSAPMVNAAPESRSRDLARLIDADPSLSQATIIAEPDYLLEALPYYVANPTYLLREARHGSIVKFTNDARLVLSLDELLQEALRLRDDTGRPVVILLAERLDAIDSPAILRSGYNWQLTVDAKQIARFEQATVRLRRFEPACCSNESFDVYLLRGRDST